jgi:hypothetical protein
MCYWRSAWQARPFLHLTRGEDTAWLSGVRSDGRTSLKERGTAMIAAIHRGNTSGSYAPELMVSHEEWTRVPDWDAHCLKVMEL